MKQFTDSREKNRGDCITQYKGVETGNIRAAAAKRNRQPSWQDMQRCDEQFLLNFFA